MKSNRLNIVWKGKVIGRLNTDKKEIRTDLEFLGYKIEEPKVKLSSAKQRIILEMDADPLFIEKVIDTYVDQGKLKLITARIGELPIKGSVVENWCKSSRQLHQIIKDQAS
jgi:hypothetical protein